MGAGIMIFTGEASYPWQNATDGEVGFGVALTADEKVNLATAKTDAPFGILGAKCKQNDFAQIILPSQGKVVEAVCGAAITTAFPGLVYVTVDGTGRFITAVKTTTTGARNFVWGFAMKSTTAAGQKFPLLFVPTEMDIT